MQRQRGLTLLELLVVMSIIGLAIASVSLSLRDNRVTQLEREAQRLVAILEATRAQSRTSGVALVWQPSSEGFVIRGIDTRTESWLYANTQATVEATTPNSPAAVVLGPEPILPPTRITLRNGNNDSPNVPVLRIGTDGLTPFRVLP